jgi:cytochrome c peroxidase
LAALVAGWSSSSRASPDGDLAALRTNFVRPAAATEGTAPRDAPLVRLGRHLFFERLLSGSGRMACSTCHDPARLFQDDRPRAVGVFYRALARRTPSLFDLAEVRPLMRDGRAASLEQQVLMPILDPDEMGQTEERLLQQLGRVAFYREAFAETFPAEGLSTATLARALAAYVRTLESPKTAFDAWVEGDVLALDERERAGFALFVGKAGCIACHSGWRLTDDRFHDIGLPTSDLGRGRFDPDPRNRFAFRTPSLRWVARRPPYMHDGSLPNLRAVIEHYDRGGIDRPGRSPLARPLALRENEKVELLAFLESVSRPPADARASER